MAIRQASCDFTPMESSFKKRNPRDYSVEGGKARQGVGTGATRFAKCYAPDDPEPARAFIKDMCLNTFDKEINLTDFDEYDTYEGSNEYRGVISLSDNEIVPMM